MSLMGIHVPVKLDTSNQVLHALTIMNVIMTLMVVLTTVRIHKGRSTVVVKQGIT